MNRRRFLRGVGGIAVGLPTLEIMLNRHGDALASGLSLPKRFFVGFAGHSLGADGDTVHDRYVPDTIGPGYDLKTGTATLANHGYVADEVTIVSGLRVPYDTGSGIPAGGWGREFHIQALGPLLSGVRSQDASDHGVNGPTADQLVADAFEGQTIFRSLSYRAQASWYLTVSAPYGRDILSYRRDANGDLLAVPGQVSPRAAWEALFTSFVPPDDEDAAAKAAELLKRRSVIDLVRADYELLVPKLGRADRVRLEQHLDELRTLEVALDAEGPATTETCFALPDPGPDPAIGASQEFVGGSGFDTSRGWSDETTRARVLSDLIAMAFTCDLTRSAALMYTMAQSHMNVHSFTGQPYDQHELGHAYLGTEVFSLVAAWHLDQFGYLVAKLRDTPEGAGSVLDGCAMVLLHEGGHGYDPGSASENSSHSTENMACCVAGGAGGLVRGEHVVAEGMHPGNVLNSAMVAVGVDAELGEVRGVVDGLFA